MNNIIFRTCTYTIITLVIFLSNVTLAENTYPVIQIRSQITASDLNGYYDYMVAEVQDTLSRTLASLCCKKCPFVEWVPYDSADTRKFDRTLLIAIEGVDEQGIGERKFIQFYDAGKGTDKELLAIDEIGLFPSSDYEVNNDHKLLIEKAVPALQAKMGKDEFLNKFVTEFLKNTSICSRISLPDTSYMDKIILNLNWQRIFVKRSAEFEVKFKAEMDTTLGLIEGTLTVTNLGPWSEGAGVGNIYEMHHGLLDYYQERADEFSKELRRALELHEPTTLKVIISKYIFEQPSTSDDGLMTPHTNESVGGANCAF